MPQFETAFWPGRNAGWTRFGAPVMAGSAIEAIKKRDPQALGRYRVTPVGGEGPGEMFVVRYNRRGCEAIPVDRF